jgi:hypothetical protein
VYFQYGYSSGRMSNVPRGALCKEILLVRLVVYHIY